jgi:peroxiredoxin
MKRYTLISILTILLSVSAFSQFSLKPGTEAPAFSGTAMDGSTIDLNDLRGRVVVMTFWSTRCAICQHEIPKLNQVAQRYYSRDVVFLALSMENEEKISAFLRKNPFNFQIVPNSFGVVLKYADRDKADSLDMGFPSFFLIDQNGVVRHRSSGYDKIAPLDAAIGKLLAK